MKIKIMYRSFFLVCLLLMIVYVSGQIPARAASIFNPAEVGYRELITGLAQPVFITHAGDNSQRLFIVERAGRIRIFKSGTLLATPFLDIHAIVNSTGGEQGLLALAFHPKLAN